MKIFQCVLFDGSFSSNEMVKSLWSAYQSSSGDEVCVFMSSLLKYWDSRDAENTVSVTCVGVCVSDEKRAVHLHRDKQKSHISDINYLAVVAFVSAVWLAVRFIHIEEKWRAYHSYQRKFYYDLGCIWIGRFCWFCYRRSQVCRSSEEFCAG